MGMHNIYGGSTVYSLMSRGSLPYSFNDYSYFLNERFCKTQLRLSSLSCCACCACCAFPIQRVPMNPIFLYGSRQSSLLQLSACRRLILIGSEPYLYRLPVCGHKAPRREVPCCVKERTVCNRRRRRHRRCCCVSSEENSEIDHSGDDECDAESVLSLLSDEVTEDCFVGRGRRVASVKRAEVEKDRDTRGRNRNKSSFRRELQGKRESGEEISRSSVKTITVDKRVNDAATSYGGERRNQVRAENFSRVSEMKSNNDVELVSTVKWEEESRQKGSRTSHSKEEYRKGRKGASSCSSYYSFTSGDLMSDNEEQFIEESSSRHRRDTVTNADNRLHGQITEEFKRYDCDVEVTEEAIGQKNVALQSGAQWDLTKKHEKKLGSEFSEEEARTVRESSQMRTRVSRINEGDFDKSSSSEKKFSYQKQNLDVADNFDEETRKGYYLTGRQAVSSERRGEYEKHQQRSKISSSDVETTSWSREGLVSQEQDFEIAEDIVHKHDTSRGHQGTVHVASGEGSLRQRHESQQLVSFTGNEDNWTKRSTDHQKQSKQSRKGSKNRVMALSHQTEEQLHQMKKHVVEQMDSRTQHLTAGSEAKLNNQDQSSNLVLTSYPEAEDVHTKADQKTSQRIQSGQGSHNVINISVIQNSKEEITSSSQTTLQKIVVHGGSQNIIAGKPVEEMSEMERRNLQIKAGREAQRPVEDASLRPSLTLVSQATVQETNLVEEEKRSSQAVLVPPQSQLVARNTLHAEITSGIEMEGVSRRMSESGSSSRNTLHADINSGIEMEGVSRRMSESGFSSVTMHSGEGTSAFHSKSGSGSGSGESYGDPLYVVTPEDALGSADRLEKSSTQFVEEFVEKARNEVLTHEIKKEDKVYETNIGDESEKFLQESSSNVGSAHAQMKESGSRRSSQHSGAKGPSDEIWHETELSFSQTSTLQVSEGGSKTEDVTVKRSGRSLWNIIGDMVLLKWKTETPKSAERSGGKSSSNESVRNETRFSGPDETADSRIKMGKSMLLKVTSSDKLKLGEPSAQKLEAADKMRPSKEMAYLEAENPASGNTVGSGSTSVSNLLASQDKNYGLKIDGQNTNQVSSFEGTLEFSLPLPARGTRISPVAEENPHSGGKIDASGSRSMKQMEETLLAAEIDNLENRSMKQIEHPSSARLPEEPRSETRVTELRSRKFQRANQFQRDRFDEWEEAYNLEFEQRKIDEIFMREALVEAKKAGDTWEVPVGAVLVQHGKIIARGYNLVEQLRDSTAHAEMICIREASNSLKTWRLAETTLYVTLEPCPMCAGAIMQARIDTVVWGAPNKLLGADGSWIRLFPDGEGSSLEKTDKPAAPVHPFHPKMTIRRGVLEPECANVMQEFFQLRRRKKQKKPDSPERPACLPITHHPSKFLTKMHDIFHVMFCL